MSDKACDEDELLMFCPDASLPWYDRRLERGVVDCVEVGGPDIVGAPVRGGGAGGADVRKDGVRGADDLE